jgi:putative NIF3 family GTP cyclohydrolase 1 type 2
MRALSHVSPNTCGSLISGDLEAEVKGIATTFMATPRVIREAAAREANLIITHEPTFFNHADRRDWLHDDEVYQRKQALIDALSMNIWRFHDHMHAMNPDLIYRGVIRALQWEAYADPFDRFLYTLPPITVPKLAKLLTERLQIEAVRVVGNREARVEKVGLFVGGYSLGLGSEVMPMEFMRRHQLDVIIAGESLEWTLCAYVRDAAQLGLNRAMIVAGHNRTEEAGMKYLTEWLTTVLPGIRMFFVESGDPFSIDDQVAAKDISDK